MQKIRALVPGLLKWFAQNARDLPWRRTTDPYAIWISEIMLQQTQVKTVLPYWERWMKELPTVKSLAHAKPEKVLKLWEGLGYYTRARNLQKAAQEICAKHSGKFPRDFDAILALPGIGRYTAGAIASIAFNEPKPILDGNVVRVLTRIFDIEGNPREKETNKQLWQIAESLVTSAARLESRHSSLVTRHSSLLNQSLMELGALICTPRLPKCAACPVARHCIAYRHGRVEQLPNLGPRVTASARRFVAFVVEDRGRFLVRQRPAGVLNAHLWEFPNLEVTGDHFDVKQAAHDALGIRPAKFQPLCTIKHSITRYRITLESFQVDGYAQAAKLQLAGQWAKPGELQQLSFPSAHKKILAHLPANDSS